MCQEKWNIQASSSVETGPSKHELIIEGRFFLKTFNTSFLKFVFVFCFPEHRDNRSQVPMPWQWEGLVRDPLLRRLVAKDLLAQWGLNTPTPTLPGRLQRLARVNEPWSSAEGRKQSCHQPVLPLARSLNLTILGHQKKTSPTTQLHTHTEDGRLQSFLT